MRVRTVPRDRLHNAVRIELARKSDRREAKRRKRFFLVVRCCSLFAPSRPPLRLPLSHSFPLCFFLGFFAHPAFLLLLALHFIIPLPLSFSSLWLQSLSFPLFLFLASCNIQSFFLHLPLVLLALWKLPFHPSSPSFPLFSLAAFRTPAPSVVLLQSSASSFRFARALEASALFHRSHSMKVAIDDCNQQASADLAKRMHTLGQVSLT